MRTRWVQMVPVVLAALTSLSGARASAGADVPDTPSVAAFVSEAKTLSRDIVPDAEWGPSRTQPSLRRLDSNREVASEKVTIAGSSVDGAVYLSIDVLGGQVAAVTLLEGPMSSSPRVSHWGLVADGSSVITNQVGPLRESIKVYKHREIADPEPRAAFSAAHVVNCITAPGTPFKYNGGIFGILIRSWSFASCDDVADALGMYQEIELNFGVWGQVGPGDDWGPEYNTQLLDGNTYAPCDEIPGQYGYRGYAWAWGTHNGGFNGDDGFSDVRMLNCASD